MNLTRLTDCNEKQTMQWETHPIINDINTLMPSQNGFCEQTELTQVNNLNSDVEVYNFFDMVKQEMPIKSEKKMLKTFLCIQARGSTGPPLLHHHHLGLQHILQERQGLLNDEAEAIADPVGISCGTGEVACLQDAFNSALRTTSNLIEVNNLGNIHSNHGTINNIIKVEACEDLLIDDGTCSRSNRGEIASFRGGQTCNKHT